MATPSPQRSSLKESQRIVVKIGSRVLVDSTGRPDLERISHLVTQMAQLQNRNKEIVLVSSGAVAAGVQELGMKSRPTDIPKLQMAASVGQVRLMTTYEKLFSERDCLIGQVLLTRDDLKNRARHLNARYTMLELLKQKIIPIVNENDVVSVDELKFGDNDLLAALVAILIEADLLIFLTTTDGLRKPSKSGTERVPYLDRVTEEALALVSDGNDTFSLGGMTSKLRSAQTAVKVGIRTLLADGRQENILDEITGGKDVGTLVGRLGDVRLLKLNKRKQWIAFFQRTNGILVVDEGAQKALQDSNHSLLPIGIRGVEGQFSKGSLVKVKSPAGQLIAKGLVDYSSEDIMKIKGYRTSRIAGILGAKDYNEVIHRENMVVLDNR